MTTAMAPGPRRHTSFKTGDGVRIAAQDWAGSDGQAVLFIHGFSQCHLSWSRQVASPLVDEFRLLTYDLRGHGASDKPDEAEYYQDGTRWADELQAVLDHFALDRAVIVAWSYAGRILGDYVRRHGTKRIAGINLVGSKTRSDPQFVGAGIRELQAEMTSSDIGRNVAGTIGFLTACAQQWDEDEFRRQLAFNMLVPSQIRGHLMGRSFDADDLYSKLDKPLLLTHGSTDRIVPVAAGMAAHALVPGSRLSIYDGIGHAPFLEDSIRFNSEIADFARRCWLETA